MAGKGYHTELWDNPKGFPGKPLPGSTRRTADGYLWVIIDGINTYPTREQAVKRAKAWSTQYEFRTRVFKMGEHKWGVFGTD